MSNKLFLILIGLMVFTSACALDIQEEKKADAQTKDNEKVSKERTITLLNPGGGISCPEGTEFVGNGAFVVGEGSVECRILVKGEDFVRYGVITVERGMIESQVRNILGEPDVIQKEGVDSQYSECWFYEESEAEYKVCFDKTKPFSKVSYHTASYYNLAEKSETSCKSDADCVIMSGDLCGCGGLGRAKTVNKESFDRWQSLMKEGKIVRPAMACPAAMSDHISCYSEAKCITQQCTLVPIKEQICDTYLFTNCKNSQTENCQKINALCK